MIDPIGALAAPAPAEARTTSAETPNGPPFGAVLTQAQSEKPEAETPEASREAATQAVAPTDAALVLMMALAAVMPAAQPVVASSPAPAPEANPAEAGPAQAVSVDLKSAPLVTTETVIAETPDGAATSEAQPVPVDVPAPETNGDFAKLLAGLPPVEAKESPQPALAAQAVPTEVITGEATSSIPAQAQAEGVKQTEHAPPPAKASPMAERKGEPPPIAIAMTATPPQPTEPARLAEAQLKTPAPISAEIALPQIVGHVQTLLRNGESAMRVQLHPESLGRIELQVTSNASGMHVRITSDLPVTGGLIERNLPDLREALTQSGLNVAGLSVNVGGGGAEAHRQSSAFAWGRQPFERPLTGLETEPANAEPLRLPVRSGSQVDYRI